jgi:hypothetical protein
MTHNAYITRTRTDGGLLLWGICTQIDNEIVNDYFACDLPHEQKTHSIISRVLEHSIEMVTYTGIHKSNTLLLQVGDKKPTFLPHS